MIKAIVRRDLNVCLEIFHVGYETVATEFGLTDENCPDRGRANLPFEKLVAEFDKGTLMFGYYVENRIVGFLAVKMYGNDVLGIDDIIVLPDY